MRVPHCTLRLLVTFRNYFHKISSKWMHGGH
jgi:hypothetical protein